MNEFFWDCNTKIEKVQTFQYELTKSSVRNPLLWKSKQEQAFCILEMALPQPPSLDIPNHKNNPLFYLYMSDLNTPLEFLFNFMGTIKKKNLL